MLTILSFLIDKKSLTQESNTEDRTGEFNGCPDKQKEPRNP